MPRRPPGHLGALDAYRFGRRADDRPGFEPAGTRQLHYARRYDAAWIQRPPLIVLSGQNLDFGSCLDLAGNNSSVRGFALTSIPRPPPASNILTLVQIDGNNNVLSGNTLLGEDQLNSVTVVGSNNTIGGTTPAART